jgi:hypothetical protein
MILEARSADCTPSRRAKGKIFSLSVVVRLDPNSPDKPAAILSWDEPDDDG